MNTLQAGWKLTLLAGTALALMCAEGMAGEHHAGGMQVDTQLAQSKDDEEKKDVPILLAPIAIDAKADVITGGVQLNSEDFDRQNPQTTRDLFRQEPGVTIGSPTPISQKIYVNGIEDTNLNVDIDGARQANKPYHHIGTTIIGPGMFKSVKIESGVAPADAGPRALAGSISLETKDGRDFVSPGERFGGFAKLGYNQNTEAFSEQAAGAMRVGGYDAVIYGQKHQGRDHQDGDGNPVEGTRPDNTNFIAKVGYTRPDGYRVKVSGTRYDDVSVRDGRMNFNVTPNLGVALTDYSRQQLTFSFGDETPTDMWDPKLSLSRTFTHLTADFSNNTYISAWIESYNGKASNTITTKYGKITSGFDFFVDTGTGASDVTGGGITRRGLRFTEREHDYGLFTQARLSPIDDLRTSFGGRVDYHRLEGNDDTVLNNVGPSGNVNVEYDVTNNVMGYAGVSTVSGGVPMTEVGIMGTYYDYTDVDPSRSYNGKIGANMNFGNFTVDGHIFRTRIDNAHNLTTTTRKTAYNVETEGGNLTVRYDYDDGFVRAGYSKTKFRVDSDVIGSGSESYLGVLLGDAINFEAHHEFPSLGVRVGTTNEFVFENDDTQELVGESLNSYLVSNIYAEYVPDFANGLTLRADVRNLFDKMYVDRANIGQYSTSAAVTSFYEPGRTFLVSAKMEF
ncbi:MAG: TonB-dependent receptor domain-containing protein [Rhodospirillales bacterium]